MGPLARLPFRLVDVATRPSMRLARPASSSSGSATTARSHEGCRRDAQMPQPIVAATSHLGFSCSVREDKR